MSNEFLEVENWGGEVIGTSRKNRITRKRKSYLEKNSEWLPIDLEQKANVVPIGISRNANVTSLQPIGVYYKILVHLIRWCIFFTLVFVTVFIFQNTCKVKIQCSTIF